VHLFVLCHGFVGTWLLVAGPINQATLELRIQQLADDRVDHYEFGAAAYWLTASAAFALRVLNVVRTRASHQLRSVRWIVTWRSSENSTAQPEIHDPLRS
jgi:hypothetical protein